MSDSDETLLRLRQIIGCPKRKIQPMLPVSASKWWKLVRTGQIPRQIKIGKNAYWLKSDITQFIENAAKNR